MKRRDLLYKIIQIMLVQKVTAGFTVCTLTEIKVKCTASRLYLVSRFFMYITFNALKIDLSQYKE